MNALVDSFAHKGMADLVRELRFIFRSLSFSDLMYLPAADRRSFISFPRLRAAFHSILRTASRRRRSSGGISRVSSRSAGNENRVRTHWYDCEQ